MMVMYLSHSSTHTNHWLCIDYTNETWYKLTPCSKIYLQKLIVCSSSLESFHLYVTQGFITVFTRTYH
jgi:hypothetical protein